MDAREGVYFRREDYAGFWLRLLIDLIDVVVVAGVHLFVLATVTFPSTEMVGDLLLVTSAIVVFSYFVILKRSRIGTVGFRVVGFKVVGLNGQPADWFSLTLRLLFAVLFGGLGPLSVLDQVWLSSDTHRQTLRDKFAQTYVVKKEAQPVGSGRIEPWNYEICCYNFIFREVEAKSATTAPNEGMHPAAQEPGGG